MRINHERYRPIEDLTSEIRECYNKLLKESKDERKHKGRTSEQFQAGEIKTNIVGENTGIG